MRCKLFVAIVVVVFLFGMGISPSQASIDIAGGSDNGSFQLNFDENGHGAYNQYDINNLGWLNDPGQMTVGNDPTSGVTRPVLYYVLPETVGLGDVRIWENTQDSGVISDVLRFTTYNSQYIMIYYSGLGDADLADVGLPQNPNYRDVWTDNAGVDHHGVLENGVEGGVRDFTWAPDGAGTGNSYYGISDVPEAASIIIWFGLSSMFVMRVWRRRKIAVPTTPSRRLHWSDESRMAIHQIIEKGCRH